MEKIFVHPECPFSEKTFELLPEFLKEKKLTFYIAHKNDF
jgi:5-methylcytosine-specific restriction enzyme B